MAVVETDTNANETTELARPFEVPTASTPFRFRYTSYLGEKHPATNKVVVEFSPTDLGLTPVQASKLIKLSGPRYNPSTEVVKMSCELFDTLPQNKRFLGDSIAKLLVAAKDPADTFEDVPFDFRHHKPKVRHEFPKEWALTDERKRYLAESREKKQRLDHEKLHNGELLDGSKIIATALPFTFPTAEPVPVLVGKSKRR
jgi:small subunit ribosomal protein S35